MNYAASLPFPIFFFFGPLSLLRGTSHQQQQQHGITTLHPLVSATTHLDRVKTFVRGVQRDFPEGPFPETRNFFVPVQPLLARFGVLPFDEDRRADRRHGGRRKLDRPAQPLARAARSLGAGSHRFLFVSIVLADAPPFRRRLWGNGGRKVEIPLLWFFGGRVDREVLYIRSSGLKRQDVVRVFYSSRFTRKS